MQTIEEILRKLVSIKSYSGEEKEIAKYIKEYFESKGANVFEQAGNVVVHINNNSRNAIIFNAHMDTVRVQDLRQWKTDPFTLAKEDGKYFGLGVSDEKVSCAILMDMYDEIIERKLDVDVFLVFVVMEEVDGSGSKRFVKYFTENYEYEKAFCVICEPQDAEKVGLGHKGNIFFKITTKGKSAHSSSPEKGENAIEKMFTLIKKIQEDFPKRNKERDELGKATLALPTIIRGGSSMNAIPDECTAYGDIRTNTRNHDDYVNFLKEYKEIEIVSNCAPSVTRDPEKIISFFKELGIKKHNYLASSNDSVFFNNQGIAAVTFGAGCLKAMHSPNEYVLIDNITKTRKIYMDIIKNHRNLFR